MADLKALNLDEFELVDDEYSLCTYRAVRELSRTKS